MKKLLLLPILVAIWFGFDQMAHNIDSLPAQAILWLAVIAGFAVSFFIVVKVIFWCIDFLSLTTHKAKHSPSSPSAGGGADK